MSLKKRLFYGTWQTYEVENGKKRKSYIKKIVHRTMRVPKWKKWLSYLTELHIESAPSEHNPHLYVSLSRGRFQLCTANAIYSFADLYDNFVKTFERIDLEKAKIKKVLILGYGLGSIPTILEQKFNKNYEYTAVEIDEHVLYLANRYSDVQSQVQFRCADALDYVQICQEKYDLICMDVFLDDIIPDDFENQAFVKNLKRILRPDGVLLYNRLSFEEKDRVASKDFYENHFRPVFPNSEVLDVKGNWMLLNDEKWIR